MNEMRPITPPEYHPANAEEAAENDEQEAISRAADERRQFLREQCRIAALRKAKNG